jgi:hypothetical protein
MANLLLMPSENPDRQRRLAEALRANLRRRKGQTRERAQGEKDSLVGPDPSGKS